MANQQITIDANGSGVNPSWIVLRSEREDDPVGVKILVNALDRRFNTKPGTYFTNLGYGLDLEDILGSGLVPGSAERLALAMTEQAKEDERVENASATIVGRSFVGSRVAIKVRLGIVPRIGEPFALSTVVDNISVATLKVEK